ncbi:MAG: YHS domain-containing protein [Armatimonadetes bacterium]|nr:YHS domain-containing protein [Armatimonadota bacterium]
MTVKDPVCGRQVSPDQARFSTDVEGTKYYFCSEECKQKFEDDPRRYVDVPGTASASPKP